MSLTGVCFGSKHQQILTETAGAGSLEFIKRVATVW